MLQNWLCRVPLLSLLGKVLILPDSKENLRVSLLQSLRRPAATLFEAVGILVDLAKEVQIPRLGYPLSQETVELKLH